MLNAAPLKGFVTRETENCIAFRVVKFIWTTLLSQNEWARAELFRVWTLVCCTVATPLSVSRSQGPHLTTKINSVRTRTEKPWHYSHHTLGQNNDKLFTAVCIYSFQLMATLVKLKKWSLQMIVLLVIWYSKKVTDSILIKWKICFDKQMSMAEKHTKQQFYDHHGVKGFKVSFWVLDCKKCY